MCVRSSTYNIKFFLSAMISLSWNVCESTTYSWINCHKKFVLKKTLKHLPELSFNEMENDGSKSGSANDLDEFSRRRMSMSSIFSSLRPQKKENKNGKKRWESQNKNSNVEVVKANNFERYSNLHRTANRLKRI